MTPAATDAGPTAETSPAEPLEPLAGYTIGITAARRRKELGAALERRGAKVVYAPAIQIVPLADDSELLQATERCLAAPLDVVVATTGIGFRGWMDAAETWGLAEKLTEAVDAATVLARGPKARGAIRAGGLRETWSPESESSSEVLDYLMSGDDLSGKRIAVQLHGEPLRDLVDTLRLAGADVIEVPVYRWVPPDDPAPLYRLLDTVATGGVDAVAFTSAPAAVSFLQTADQRDCGPAVRAALRGPVLAACVGPVTAGPLVREDIPVVQPGRSRLGALAREIVEQVPARQGQLVPAAGHLLDVRGHAVAVDGRLVPLSSASMALLRQLIARPGQVVSRRDLLGLTPGDGGDEHAVEVAVGRLRAALGDPRIVLTVVKRGYRLAYEPERASSRDGHWRY
ncbi:uroporphyrinogen-III synthase [Pseudofrankia inefficax]|uniref:Uroporphyrinogen III synthase HEM4 n=1 Tax=Pseudofrankia inefficax (strain DSM 45817 / CECT 9037 / DDB 130130 / EuI1c) TaxID=298654 RepID=E3IVK2_PSEI1|nr:uroporphyrinogen-III synthase [Pseudofrankia inefficax]ADP82508.1 Uroporphyrinogen III synthase HEM4 [Pseudofrankia inefficax]